ncbi:ShlB/FhaC/HecB family hemolysin secretion/activation protein [Rhizobium sp. BK377]|uniref:ShlB/FhaC/HecB family hemolysin secretion/activation protein n=1 Tax=Rhizobium sp. BK377 TaxID=2587058 RepID=UPI0017D32912|nr:ShlB/FhaC/HecB family hemolysin secretion/activation protein [Rhizobium sp. BK377]MBB3462838.1 hemolysin activation/secretion protein [Rhizobium sp. BK377]
MIFTERLLTGPDRAFPTVYAGMAALSMALACSPAFGQTASQITQPSYVPPQTRQSGAISLPATTGQDAPAGAEQLFVTLQGVDIEGSFPELAAIGKEIESNLARRKVSGSDLFAAARDLETAYARAGYLLVRVSLPPQTIRNGGRLRMVVTDGYVEAIDVSALPPAVRTRVQSLLAPLVGARHVKRQEVEKRLLLADDTPGVVLNSTLKPGEKPGSTLLVIAGRYDPITADFSLDNGLSRDLGRYTLGIGTQFNSVFGLGEQMYFRLGGFPDDDLLGSDPRNRQISAGFILPLGIDGLSVNVEATDARTEPDTELSYRLRDHYQRLSTRLNYDWLRSRDFNLSSALALDVANERQTIVLGSSESPFTEDRLRVLRLSQSIDAETPWGAFLGGVVTASLGLDALGVRRVTLDLPMTRYGAEPDFRKLEARWSYSQSMLDDRLLLTVNGRAQTSFGQALAASEQIGLGGPDGLSAYDSGTLDGDSGVVSRAELAFPSVFTSLAGKTTLAAGFTPYMFASGGATVLNKPTAVESETVRASAFGVGFRAALGQTTGPGAASFSVEYAHGSDSDQGRENRINLRFVGGF